MCVLDKITYFLLTYLLAYLLHGAESILLEELSGSQLVKKLPAFYGARRFITAVISAPPPVPILSQLNPVHALTPHLLKIYLNIILPSVRGPSKWTLSLMFPHQNPVYTSTLPHTCYIPCLPHSSRIVHLNKTGQGAQIVKLLIM